MGVLHTQCERYWKSGESTNPSFAAKVDQIAKPSGTNILDLAPGLPNGSPEVPNNLLINPYGTDANNETFSFRVWGWAPVRSDTPTDPAKREQWHATLLGGFDATLSSSLTGVSGGVIANTRYYADTIALRAGEGTANVSNEIVSVASDVGAHVSLDAKGFQVIEFEFALGTAAAAAVLVKTY